MSRSRRRSVDFVRLKPEFFKRLQSQGWPKRDIFVRYFKSKGYEESSWRGYAGMRRGDAVPRIVGVCLVEYVREKWGLDDVTVENSLEFAIPPKGGVWDGGWSGILNLVTEKFQDCDDMYVHNPRKEIPVLAKKFVMQVGRMNVQPGDLLDDSSCISRGEGVMKRSHEDYARWLVNIHGAEYRSIMYAVIPDRSGLKKVSACFLIPITRSAFERFCNGDISDEDIGQDDVECPSKYFLMEALLWLTAPGEVPDSVKDAAEVNCMMYQCAYFTRIKTKPWRPKICAIGGIPFFRDRLLNLGFEETGTNVKHTDKPILVLQHPREPGAMWSFKRWVNYKSMQLTLRFYQLANHKQWREEDRLG